MADIGGKTTAQPKPSARKKNQAHFLAAAEFKVQTEGGEKRCKR